MRSGTVRSCVLSMVCWTLLNVQTASALPPFSTTPPATREAERGSGSMTTTPPQTEISTAQQSGQEFNCLADWLRISGATAEEVLSLPSSSPVIEASLDEESIKEYQPFFLALIVNYNRKLAVDLKQCVGRTRVCPAGSAETELPCSETGRCLFNAAARRTACACPVGLTGVQCEIDVNECKDELLNDCDDITVANCLNVHGSYGCVCRQGYEGLGQDCSDIDECLTSAHDCSQDAACRNTNGSYECQCKGGYLGDGVHCTPDSCSGSKNLELCQEIQQVRLHNENLEQKLAERDDKIQQLMSDMKLMAGLITDSRHTIDHLTVHVQRRTNQLRTQLETSTSTLKAVINAKIDQTKAELKAEAAQTKNDISDAIMATETRLHNKCGVVSWKSFSQYSTNKLELSWSVVFNKTRPDTVLRFVYTSYFGLRTEAHGQWYCFKVSILIDGYQCANPGPITGGSSSYESSNSQFSNPGTISGVCNIGSKGALQLSTQTEKECNYPSNYNKYHGYYAGTGRTTSTLHVEELLEC